jgi:hypothetical protein
MIKIKNIIPIEKIKKILVFLTKLVLSLNFI